MKSLALLILAFHAAPASAEKLSVIYEVPAPVSLDAFSRFEILYETRAVEGGRTELRYILPATLLGHEQEIALVGQAEGNAFAFTGENAEMKCVTNSGSALCRVVHHGLSVDLAGVQNALALSNLSQAQRDGKLALASFVAREGGGDMVGVMAYVLGLNPR